MERNVKGLVTSMNNINTSFNSLKFIVVVIVIASLLISSFCVIYTFIKVSDFQNKIYVLDRGASFSASIQDANISKEDEVKDQIIRFHELFFNMPPDMAMIKKNVENALLISDRSVYDYFQDLNESGFFKSMLSANAYEQVNVEKIDVNLNVYPYEIKTVCSQYILRASNISKYTLVTTCRIINVPRSANNLHGLMIQDFTVIDNKLVETRQR